MAAILIIDDEPADVKYLEALLTELGYIVQTASNTQSGLEQARDKEIKLIISDLDMPGKLQYMALVRKLRKIRPDCPLIIISGYPTNKLLEEAKQTGVIDFLTKPFEIPFLTALLRRLLPLDSASTKPTGPK